MPSNELETLKQENALLRADLKKALLSIEKLTNENNVLRTEIKALKRKQARQAAPFSKNEAKINPKISGRKKGIGEFKYLKAPQLEEISQTINVPLLEVNCTTCGATLPSTPSGIRVAWVTKLPELKNVIFEYRLEEKICTQCGIKVIATHPAISKSQQGATAHRLDPEVMALAHVLQYQMGVTARKVPAIMLLTLGLRLTQSAITQAALKNSVERRSIGIAYKTLRSEIKNSHQVNTDDTGWRMNGKAAYLMVFKTNTQVVYQIRVQHRATEVAEVIPESYQGVMGTDRFKSYNAKVFEAVKQQKCVSHILKNIKEHLETQKGRVRSFPLSLREVFKSALALYHRYHQQEISLEAYFVSGLEWQRRLTKLLATRARPLSCDNERLRRELEYHHARGNLLRFLENPLISPTNNAAERALRPNVIFRKLCGGSKNENGARALEAYTSVIQTARIQGLCPMRVLTELYAKKLE